MRGLRIAGTVLLLLGFLPTPPAAALDQHAGQGKRALCVYNQSKLEKARGAESVDPKRMAQLETWRKTAQNLIVISESVDAVDVSAKYRYVGVPLAAGLSAGIQNVLVDEHCKMDWGKPGLGATTIATLLGEPDKAAIFAYEKGATMSGEFLAPARRVSFFLWQDTFDQLRPEGLALFKAAVLWAVSPPE